MERVVYLGYEEGSTPGEKLPTLYDNPHEGTVEAVWRDDNGKITVQSVED